MRLTDTAAGGRGGRVASRRLLVRGVTSLVILTLLAVTLQSLVFSGASFSDTDSASASFQAGSVGHSNTAADTFVLDVGCLRPGLSRNATLTIAGEPDVPAAYGLYCTDVTDVPAARALSAVLQLQIDDLTGGASLYDGPANGFASATLGVIAPTDVRQYRFTLTYPASAADRALMGASTTLTFEFVGVSL